VLAVALAACGGSSDGASSAGAPAQVAVAGSGVTVDALATQSWSGGFNGVVRITDTAFSAPITSFEVVFKLAGNAQVVGTGWNGTISAPDASGNRTATSPSWMQYQPLRAGQAWDVGFGGSGTFAGSTIVSVKVNGGVVPPGLDNPPTVSLASSATTVTVPASFTLTATAVDDKGVGKVELYDGATLLGTSTAAPYALTIPTTTAMIGTHAYTARAYDTAGQSTTSSPVAVVVQGLVVDPPTVSVATSATTITAPGCITLTAAASSAAGIARVEFYEPPTLLGADTTAPYTWQVCFTQASNGTHSYVARAYDPAGNLATSSAVTVTVNIPVADAPPTVALASSATAVTTPSTITLTATAADDKGVTRVEFYDGATLLGSKAAAPYTQAVSFTLASNGTHVMTARAYDTASQATTSTAVNVVVTIPDTTPPVCTLAVSTTLLTAPGTVTLNATASDNVAVAKVDFYDASALLGSDGSSPYSMVLAFTAANNGTHAFGCKCSDAAGNVGSCQGASVVVAIPVSTADVTLTIDTAASRKAISPYVYGYNASRLADAPPGTTYLRIGGNRWTAYNWTNNWSNAGSDWGPYANDTFMGTAAQGPGAAILPTIDDAKANNIAALVTIPIQGWVSQAKSGNVPLADPVTSWFVPNVPAKGSAFTLTPSPTSATVYQDELASFVANRWAGAAPHLSLDNEPDLWGYVASGAGTGTHPEIQRTQLTYAAFLQESIASARAIKAAVPAALVYGPVSYGWNGMLSFQNAPDSTGATIDSSFLDYYLAQMAAASTSRRLLDVLDVHWYSEATSSGCTNAGVRVINTDNSDCVVAARVQAPRSLFDPAYVETSWITQWTTASSAMGAGIQLVPRLQAKVAAKFPGTRLALTEYNHGGEDHVSGAVAEADTLGIFGREGVYAAAFWSVNASHAWAHAAWKAFRNYDGSGHSFGDTSVSAGTSDLSHVSVYASVDAASPDRLVLVIVHRPTLSSAGALDLKARTVQVNWTHSAALRTARAWQLAGGASPAWQALSVPAPAGNTVTLTLPALSVTTVELTP
jgi:hypothetical protein